MQTKPIRTNAALTKGVAAVTLPDLRRARQDIKSASLLAQVLAKHTRRAGTSKAGMVEDGALRVELRRKLNMLRATSEGVAFGF